MGLAAQRLLGDQRVGPDGTGVDLVVNQVVELEHIHDAHGDFVFKPLAGAAVAQDGLAYFRQTGLFEDELDLRLVRSVEDRGGHVKAPPGPVGQFQKFLVGEILAPTLEILGAQEFFESLAQGLVRGAVHQLSDLPAQFAAGPTQVGLHNLPHVHAAGDAQGVQHQVHRGAVFEEGHILLGQNPGDDALVAVTPGHLVAHGKLALHGHIDLDHFDDPRRHLVALLELGHALFKDDMDEVHLLLVVGHYAAHRLGDGPGLVLRQLHLGPGRGRNPVDGLGRDEVVLFQRRAVLAAVGDRGGQSLALQIFPQTLLGVLGDDVELVLLVLHQAGDLIVFDLLGALVLVDALAVEDPGVNDRALDPRRHPQGGVLDVGSLLAEDGPEQLFLGRKLGFALGGDLADQDVAGLDLGPDADNAGAVEVGQGILAQVGDVAGYFLRPQFGVAGHSLEFLDMDGGEDILLDQALGNEDGILEVVAAPGHEGHHDVPAQSQFAHFRGRAVGDDLALFDQVAGLGNGALVEAGALVGALEFGQLVDVDPLAGGVGLAVGVAHHDARGVGVFHHAVILGHHRDPRVTGHHRLDARAHQGRVGAQKGHGLALHIGAHQGPVGVVVFQEGHQRGGHRHQLVGRDVHETHFILGHQHELAVDVTGHLVGHQAAPGVKFHVGLGPGQVLFLQRGQVAHLGGGQTILHLAIGRLD